MKKNIIKKINKVGKKIKSWVNFSIKKVKKFFIQIYKKSKKRLAKITKKYPNLPVLNYKSAIATLILFAVLLSSLWGNNAIAATYIFSQSSWAGGVSANTATHASNQNNWTNYAAISGAEVINGGANITLASASTTFTETFGSTTYKDSNSTTANWSTGGQLEMQSGTAFSWYEKFNGVFRSNSIMVAIVVGEEIYAAGTNAKFAKYNRSTRVTTDLSSSLSPFWGSSSAVAAMAYDSAGGDIYLGGTTEFAKFNIASGVATDLTPTSGVLTVGALALDSVHRTIYVGANGGNWGKYNPAANSYTNLTTKIASFWSTNAVSALATDTAGTKVYLGGVGGKFAVYDTASDTATDKTSKISSIITTAGVTNITLDTQNSVLYLGTSNGKFVAYSVVGDTATDKTSKISAFTGSNNIRGLAYASSKIYIVGGTILVEYSPSLDTAANKSSILSGAILGNLSTMYRLGADGVGEKLYIPSGPLMLEYNIQAGTATNLTPDFSPVIGTSAFYKAVYDDANNAFYVVSIIAGGAFFKFNADTNTITYLSLAGLSSVSGIYADFSRGYVYVSGGQYWDDGYDAGTYPAFIKHNISSGAQTTVVDATGNIAYALGVDTTNNVVYMVTDSPRFLKYNVGTGAFTNITAVTGLTSPSSLAVNSTGTQIYIGSNSASGALFKYEPNSNIGTNLTSITNPVFGASSTTVVMDSASEYIYIGGISKFAKYNLATGTITDLTSGLLASGFPASTYVRSLYADPTGPIYIGSSGPNKTLIKYDPGSNSFSNLTSSISFWTANSDIYSIMKDSSSGNIYLFGTNKEVAYLTAACTTCYGVSAAVDSTSSNIISATLTANNTGSVNYYLSNDGGVTWAQVTPGALYAFATTGSDLRFKAELSGSATVQDVSIAYNYYPTSGTLTSSIFDTEDAGNVMGGISWTEDETLPAGTTVSLGLRTASSAEALATASWTNITSSTSGCEKTAGRVVCSASAIPQSMKSGGDDRYFQYQINLGSTGTATPSVSAVEVTYVVNARPEFNTSYPEAGGTGAQASQVLLPESENFGKVFIQYSVRDTDSPLGSITPGYITPSFEYNIGSGWVAINSTYLRQTDVENKQVDTANYTEYSALWDVKSQIPGQYSETAQIRVTINDNEAANNTASAESLPFALDTTDPTITAFTIDSSTDTITLQATDNANISYRLANSADYADAGSWVDTGTNNVDVDISDWQLPGGGGAETVYIQIKDANGNMASSSAIAPATVNNLDLRDVGNAQTNEFREFLAWGLYPATDGAQFVSYEVYRSSDSTNYTLLSSITDINQNYLTDSNVSNAHTYYYKIYVVDADGDKSSYSTIVSDTPDGQGGTDFTAPAISDVAVTETQTTWVKITWTTDELSDSEVEYSVSPDTTFTESKRSTALVRNHEVVVDGLTPNTDYLFQVNSTDILSNVGTENNGGAGYEFSTAGGPSISDVAIRSVDDNTATIVWNTDRSANSYVIFSTDMGNLESNTNVQTVGSADFVQDPFEHQVVLTGLLSKTTYYFYVKSTDEQSGYESVDNRSGNFYTFNTTNDQKAPTISNIEFPITSPNAATVTWTTDELADSVVVYGTTEGTYDLSSSRDSTMSIYHVVTLNGLTPETTYYIKVKSADSADNESDATSSFATRSEFTVVYQSSGGGGSSAETDTTPPRITNLKVSNETAFGATISIETDEDTVAFVNFGTELQYDKSNGSSTANTAHEIKLFGLRSGTTYNFEAKVFDEAGNMAASANRTFTTKFASEMMDEMVVLDNMEEFQEKIESLIESTLPSLIPPVINEIEVTNVGDTSADISWKTNVKSFSIVALVKGDKFDPTVENPYEFEMSNVEEKVKDHKLTLQSLEPGTKYHFQVKSFSIPGVIGKSKDYNFATRAANARAGAVKTTNNSFTVSWQTADATTSFVEYTNLKTGKTAEVGSKELTKNHIVDVTNLPGATTFEVKYYGHTQDGVKIEGSSMRVTTLIDTKAPAISDVSISSAFIPYRPNQLQTLISWKTDEPANSIVEYEEGPGSAEKLANKLGEAGEYTKEHIVILPGFKPGTIYRVRITSSDMAGNNGIVPTRTIVTPVASDSVFEIIINNFEDVFGFLKNVR